MTSEATERARALVAFLAGEKSFDGTWFGERNLSEPTDTFWWRRYLNVILEALTPPPPEDAVEAVARALCNRGHTIDRYQNALPEIKDYWRRQAETAIAAMPSSARESDAGVTEEMREVGARELCQGSPLETAEDVVARVYTAMTSARARRG